MRIANYKIKACKELLTSQAGAILFGEFLGSIGFYSSLSSYMPLPGNHRGYEAKLYISSLIMMLHIGGKLYRRFAPCRKGCDKKSWTRAVFLEFAREKTTHIAV